MKQVLLLVIFSTLVLSSIASIDVAAQIIVSEDILFNQMNTTAVIHTNGSTSITIDAKVTNIGSTPLSSANIRVDSLALNVTSVVSGSEVTDFTTITMDRHTMIVIQLRNDLNTNESEWIHLELQSYDIQSNLELDESGNFKHGSLVYYIRPHVSITNYTFVAMLPAHASLSHESSVPLFPEADTNFTDGQRIAFKWFVSSIQPGQEHAFIIRYQVIDDSEIVTGVSILTFVLVGLVGAVFGLGIAILGPKLDTRIRRIGDVQYAGITREETIILETLKMKGGSYSQKELYSELDISESKLSLILSGLEEKGLVKRLREGRANIVHTMEKSE
ncbi:MAG: helix-turn-helix transcriptional regulator [Candidatus Thorarchaeota archaeon]